MKGTEQLLGEIRGLWDVLSARRPGVQLMEVCGTHTVTIGRGGMRDVLPPGLRLVSGPGCPVCVTDQSYMDQAIYLSRRPEVMIATYGDMIRVPGRDGSLEQSRSGGADVRVVASAHEAVALARDNPTRKVVFLAVGFETTTPATALAILQAQREGVKNFYAFCAHKRVLPAMEALLEMPDVRIDGFICPGHVSVILGWKAYEPLARKYHRPFVVAGFEEHSILECIREILEQLINDQGLCRSVYSIVPADGNPKAQAIIEQVFCAGDARWRAIGTIPNSGWDLRPEFAQFDAARNFELPDVPSYELPGCHCGEVITGRCLPTDCKMFGKVCTPRNPIGPCMVSSEGTCAAYYKYRWRPEGARK